MPGSDSTTTKKGLSVNTEALRFCQRFTESQWSRQNNFKFVPDNQKHVSYNDGEQVSNGQLLTAQTPRMTLLPSN